MTASPAPLVPDGVIYLDGNSLGPPSARTRERLLQVIDREWGADLIASWNMHGWIDLPTRLGGMIAPLIGAGPDEVIVADSVSVNLFKLAAAALKAQRPRFAIVCEAEEFPTDGYVMQGLADFMPGVEVRAVPRSELARALDDDTALLLVSHVHYRTGELHDLAELTRRAHAAGAMVLADLSHSAGVIPMSLSAWGVDLATGCGYKYLNGGPGAPAFLYVARRRQVWLRSPLTGWFGHARPFAFEGRYEPADGMARWLCGTPSVLALAALEAGLEAYRLADVRVLRAQAMAQTDLFIAEVEAACDSLILASPREASRRGAQVSFRHPQGYAVMQALIAAGVVGDFRAPDIVRFGFAPLYVTGEQVREAVRRLRGVLETEAWREPRFQVRAAVT
jgi:kynureninase